MPKQPVTLRTVMCATALWWASLCLGSPLPSAQAFSLAATASHPRAIRLDWTIQPGYQLHRHTLHLTSTDPTLTLGTLSDSSGPHPASNAPSRPYHLILEAPITRRTPGQTQISVHYQGCLGSTFCYPPDTKTYQLKFDRQHNLVALSPLNVKTSHLVTNSAVILIALMLLIVVYRAIGYRR